ncbi:MAG: EF-P beta-lysylation protein EpmB [Proteobacteria bacterium]|nr:MAG: EF-P beta-lysylation protein EpmB [Pseudomonadota bacterium]
MITGIAVKNQTKNTSKPVVSTWQAALATAIRDPSVLLERLNLKNNISFSDIAQRQFRLLVPESYLQRMRPGDPNDPLLRQVLPINAEMQILTGYQSDPVGDSHATVAPGLLHKYQGRALLLTTKACAIHCRYCFRRHFPYSDSNPLHENWQSALNYLKQHSDIHEIILSGGDPLTLSDARLYELGKKLARLTNIQRLRLHTRLPIVLPERIDENLLTCLAKLKQRFQLIIVIHANHAQELAATDVQHALNQLHQANITLLNQSVLLRSINDNTDTLCQLSEALFAQHVLPYYLHVLDKVQGAAHFAVPDELALFYLDTMRKRLSGYLIPKLVRELAGAASKCPLPTV